MSELGGRPLAATEVAEVVREVVWETRVIDIHTHLFPPAFASLALWGVDELLTYHYLEAELFRSNPIRPAAYWQLSKAARAELIWQTLFVDNSPISDASRGVIAVLSALGVDTAASDLDEIRDFFVRRDANSHLQDVLEIAGVERVVMTNDPLDPTETRYWDEESVPGAFAAALRVDRILVEWDAHFGQLESMGYRVDKEASTASMGEVRRFLLDWFRRLDPMYMAVSLPPTFAWPSDTTQGRLLAEAVLPACHEAGIPMALMIGVRRGVNPALKLAGDASGVADVKAVANLCEAYPENRFLVTMLARENQHELCVYARKFPNLMPFGCWWFLNNTSIIEEITRERVEMLGTSFIPQHSDARVLEQLIYKWQTARAVLSGVLTDSYRRLVEDGGHVTRGTISRDVRRLLRDNFISWTEPSR